MRRIIENFLFLLILPIIANTTDNNEINHTFKLLEEGKDYIKLSREHTNVIMVVGNTGAGKSTFIQWLAGDNSKMRSKEVAKGIGEYIIEDESKRIGSSINSQTIFPELVLHTKTKAAYYDCPGFSDTRSTSYDIAATYFVKKLADHVENVKLLLAVGYPAVKKGVDRQDFMKLLRHSTDLIKNIEKYRNSIAIVITKVDNILVKEGKGYKMVPDELIIDTIASFMQIVKEALEEKSKLVDTSSEEKTFCYKAIELLNILVEKDHGNRTTKIGIFRRPDKAGPLDKIPLLMQGKKHIENILDEKLEFTKKSEDDFGYSISEKSKNDVNVLVEKINDLVWADLSVIVDKLQKFYSVVIDEINGKINSLYKYGSVVPVGKTEAHYYATKLNTGLKLQSQLSAESQNITDVNALIKKTKRIVTLLGIQNCTDMIKNMSIQGDYFEFLQIVSNSKLNARPWSELFQKIEIYLKNSRKNIRDHIDRAAQNIFETIRLHSNKIALEIEKYFIEKIESMEIEAAPEVLNQGGTIVLNFIADVKNITSADELSKKLSYNLIKLNISTTETSNSISQIFHLGKYLEFLQHLKNETLNTWSPEWIVPFKNTEKALSNLEKWFIFFNKLYSRLSEYSIQGHRTNYNVMNIDNWGKGSGSQGINIDKKNYKQFLEKIEETTFIDISSVNKLEITEFLLKKLNDILQLTLKSSVSTECTPGYWTITGNYIRVSDFVNSDGRIKELCQKDKGNISTLNVFALNTIFFDIDINIAGAQLTMIAPRWEVVGVAANAYRTININGNTGKYHQISARDGSSGGRGGNGLPGNPGTPGGNFLGLGERSSLGNLRITANGGQGGPGQQGGHGGAGINGTDAEESNRFRKYFVRDDKIIAVAYNHIDEQYRYMGLPGTAGGDGGDGGAGGLGAQAGDIKVFDFDNSNGLHLVHTPGSGGSGGAGGIGGIGGTNGLNLEVHYCTETYTMVVTKDEVMCKKEKEYPYTKQANGENGKAAYITFGIKNPESRKPAAVVPYVISTYKTYVRENLVDNLKKRAILNFLKKIDSDDKVVKTYDTLGLVNEFNCLEKQLNSPQRTVDFLPFYQSLLQLTSDYAKQPGTENSDSHKKTLGYLYSAVLSRIYNLKLTLEPNLIINIESYLNIAKNNVNALGNFKDKKNKLNVINQCKNDYKLNFDKKIDEADHFIQTLLEPEIDKLLMQVEKKIGLLVQEIINLKQEAKAEKGRLVQKKQELENMLTANWIFKGVKMFTQVIGCFNPLGKVVGSVISTATKYAGPLLSAAKSVLKLPSGTGSILTSVTDKIRTLGAKPFIEFQKLLDKISTEVSKHPKLSDTLDKVKNVMARSKTAQESSDVNVIKFLKKELKEEFNKKVSDLKSSIAQKAVASATGVLNKFKKAIPFGDIFSKILGDDNEEENEALDEAINQAEGKIQQLEHYEMELYNKVIPMVKNMGDDISNVVNNLNNKSQVALDVTKWQVQTFLKDVKLEIRQITKDFPAEDTIGRSIEKLEDTLTTLINIYDRIHNYQEQQQLAVYIADISSPIADNIDIKNDTLREAVNDLEIVIRSNMVLEQHKIAVNALTQGVFPFAHRYLSESILPTHLQETRNFQDLVKTAVKQIENMQSKIAQYKTAIRLQDIYISSGWFSADYLSVRPFFVWNNWKYQDAISNLLSGDKVVLNANILNSPFDKDAIKFNKIGFNFNSKNITLISDLNKKLKGFKVSATHLGNSYYRYNSNIYLITSDSQNLQFSYEMDADRNPVQKNSVYEKIKSGDLMLSPYTMWEVQLINVTKNIQFKDLTIYKEKVNLELVGYGSYVTTGTNIMGKDINNYYTSVEMPSPDPSDDDDQPEEKVIMPELTLNDDKKEDSLISNIFQQKPTFLPAAPINMPKNPTNELSPTSKKRPSSSADQATLWKTSLWFGLAAFLVLSY